VHVEATIARDVGDLDLGSPSDEELKRIRMRILADHPELVERYGLPV
jgi:hypothetical protein